MKQIALDSGVEVPKNITTVEDVEDFDLHIAKDLPSWIITNKVGTQILRYLYSGLSIRESLYRVGGNNKLSGQEIMDNGRWLLEEIEKNNFHETVETEEAKNRLSGLFLYLTGKCNLSCKHCYRNSGEKEYKELSARSIKRIINYASKEGMSRIILSGGEALTREDFFELAEYIKKREFYTTLLTNGTLIKSTEDARKLSNYIDRINISLDGATEIVNDSYRGRGTYRKILNAINFFEGTGLSPNISMVVTPDNIEDIEKNFGKLLSLIETDVKFSLGGLIKRGRAECMDAGKPEEYVFRALKTIRKHGFNLNVAKFKGKKRKSCGYGESLVIGSNGLVYPCPITEEKYSIGTANKFSINSIIRKVEDIQESASIENMEYCFDCSLEYICGGACRLDNYENNGDILKPNCTEDRKTNMYKQMVKLNKLSFN